jgi:hypothetical protein
MFGTRVFAETYEDDVEIVKNLGLKPFKIQGYANNRTRYLGTAKRGGISVRVYVTALPSQFYEFRVVDKEGKNKYTINTGSGSFSDYEPLLQQILNNMVVFTKGHKK